MPKNLGFPQQRLAFAVQCLANYRFQRRGSHEVRPGKILNYGITQIHRHADILRLAMPFISYAQNYEDVILWRALRDAEKGFYVDVGAADPEEWSVTHAFYERGWSGINVEPLEEYFRKLTQARPRDINLKVVVGREAGQRTLYTIPGTGLSTLDREIAAKHRAAGWQPQETVVHVQTLTKILEGYAPPVIHFLKVDVEGAEAEVLEGLDLERIRPWIIVVEATEPFSTVSTRTNWERLVTDRGYGFSYFDGLNCFYVADEMAALKERLTVPPNVFDDFVRWPHRELPGLRAHARELERQAEEARSEAASLLERIHRLEAELETLPVHRSIRRVLQRLRETGNRLTGGGLRSLAKRAFSKSFDVTPDRDELKPSPGAAARLDRATTTDNSGNACGDDSIVAALPASAWSIYRRLQAAISNKNASSRTR